MTEAEYGEKQTQDTNQLKKAFDAGSRKGRKEGIDEMRDALRGFCAAGIAQREAKRLKEQG